MEKQSLNRKDKTKIEMIVYVTSASRRALIFQNLFHKLLATVTIYPVLTESDVTMSDRQLNVYIESQSTKMFIGEQ